MTDPSRMPHFELWTNARLTDYQDILLVTRQREVFPLGSWQRPWLDERIRAIDEVLDERVRKMFDSVPRETWGGLDTPEDLEAAIQAAMRRHPAGSALPEKDQP